MKAHNLTPAEQKVFCAVILHDCFDARLLQAHMGLKSPKTAANYISNLKSKLGYRTVIDMIIEEKGKVYASRRTT